MRQVELGVTPFAVVDLEATEIYAGAHDRIIDIAIVQMTPDFRITGEWSTQVLPHLHLRIPPAVSRGHGVYVKIVTPIVVDDDHRMPRFDLSA
jgi:DNA polymerase III epsilon subunit-like protein